MGRSLFENRKTKTTRFTDSSEPSIGRGDNDDNNMCLMSTKYRLDVTIKILSCRSPYKTRESCSRFAPRISSCPKFASLMIILYKLIQESHRSRSYHCHICEIISLESSLGHGMRIGPDPSDILCTYIIIHLYILIQYNIVL